MPLTVLLRYGCIDVFLAEEILDARQTPSEHRIHERGLAAGAFAVDVRAGGEGALHAGNILGFDGGEEVAVGVAGNQTQERSGSTDEEREDAET